MNPDFTFIWPLSCLKDGDHLCPAFYVVTLGPAIIQFVRVFFGQVVGGP